MLSTRYIELKDANAYVIEYHRHVAVSGYRFSLVCYEAAGSAALPSWAGRS